MNKEEVLKLAKLARIDMDEAEAEKLSGEFEAILGYVAEVKSAVAGKIGERTKADLLLRNVMREDSEPHESGIYTDAIVKEMPASEGNYLKVKKIL
jgi:aspartyl-tRNA(Asn)/glutamyl-tRNA(Gln) amidotransferase subunit C